MTALQYQQIIDKYVRQYEITVDKIFKTPHGKAYIKSRSICIPLAVDEKTFYICLHEIGHIATEIPFDRMNWEHEYMATKFALDEADKLGVCFSKELMQSIRGYLKYTLKKTVRKKDVIDLIPNKVFKLAGASKYYWKKKIDENKKPVVRQIVSDFSHWRNINVQWIDRKTA